MSIFCIEMSCLAVNRNTPRKMLMKDSFDGIVAERQKWQKSAGKEGEEVTGNDEVYINKRFSNMLIF